MKSKSTVPLIYNAGPYQSLILATDVLRHFWKHRQKSKRAPESGGQLFARIEHNAVEICAITGPYESDYLSRYLFVPDRKTQRADIKAMFKRELHYVGDWHTHPEQFPNPSSEDFGSMRDCFAKSKHELKSFVMVVVGTARNPRGIWVSLHNSTGHIRLLPTP